MLSKLRHYHPIATRLKHSFAQEPPQHENAFRDPFLIRNVKRIIPIDAYMETEDDLIQFGERVSNDIWTLGNQYTYSFEMWLRLSFIFRTTV